jgi:BirA family biotin operon repressor/biotin-[acetyl-CoA-carboxylase] ligase
MPEGNFAATYLCRPDRPAAEVALTSFQAALALYDTLALYVDRERLALKWPNDVLLDGGKVAGILLESAGQGARVDWLAVGIGINLAAAPSPEEVEPGALLPVSLAGAGPPDPLEVLEHLAFHMALNGRIWREAGFDALRRLWLRRAARLGERIVARTARESLTGIFETVDEAGQLVLRTAEGRRTVPAAEVFFD